MPREVTELRIDEHGDETHESWLLIRANHVSSSPGASLFDSEITHQHFITVVVSRCTRKRQLNHDWLHATQVLLDMAMSQAQWGAFVSSFGQGEGVPATLHYLGGQGSVPQAPRESRLEESQREVHDSGQKALAEVQASYDALVEAFETGGKRAQREALRDLGIRMGNAPKNMAFAAKSLTEHVENVVTKARADIEAMATAAAATRELESQTTFELGRGDDHDA